MSPASSLICRFVLMYSQLLCAKLTSALTLVVVGSLKVWKLFVQKVLVDSHCDLKKSDHNLILFLSDQFWFFKGMVVLGLKCETQEVAVCLVIDDHTHMCFRIACRMCRLNLPAIESYL